MINLKHGKRILGLTIAFAAILFVAAGVLTAADIPDQIKIENEGYKRDKKGAVTLSHKKHSVEYNVACTECHHEYDKSKNNVWKEGNPVKKCTECHDPEKKTGNALKLQTAYHNNCRACHKESGKKEAPYKICNDCHAKK
jgi:hypothetical protein